MSGFVETMHLKGMAEEDIWFARRDRELKEALKQKKAKAGQAAEPVKNPKETEH
jgi:hypothetical protein